MLPVLLFLVSLLTITLGAPAHHVECLFNGRHELNISHCNVLLSQFAHTPWIYREVIYGTTQLLPGKIPQDMSFGSCHLTLGASSPRSRATETFRLNDYKQRIELVYAQCLGRVQGYNGGMVAIGEENRFYAYLGAGEYSVERWNETISTS